MMNTTKALVLMLSVSFLVATDVSCTGGWKMTSAGYGFTLGLKDDGTLYAWGANDEGQLGIGSMEDHSKTPQKLPLTNVKWVTTYIRSIFALTADGRLFAWGNNQKGQLGISINVPTVNVPTQVGSDSDWAAVAAGFHHTLGLKSDGSLYVWGDNTKGQLGNGEKIIVTSPKRIKPDTKWKYIAAGDFRSFAIDVNGLLYGWGDNSYRQIVNTSDKIVETPTKAGNPGDNYTAIAAGRYHTLALDNLGWFCSWGRNDEGQLGDGTTVAKDFFTIALESWKAISTVNGFSVAIKDDGSLWISGGSTPLGRSQNTPRSKLQRVDTPFTWKSVSANVGFITGVTTDGLLITWGQNDERQLGDGSTMDRNQIPRCGRSDRRLSKLNKLAAVFRRLVVRQRQ